MTIVSLLNQFQDEEQQCPTDPSTDLHRLWRVIQTPISNSISTRVWRFQKSSDEEILFPTFHAIFCFLKMNFLATIIMKNSNLFFCNYKSIRRSQDEFELIVFMLKRLMLMPLCIFAFDSRGLPFVIRETKVLNYIGTWKPVMIIKILEIFLRKIQL